MNGRLRFISLFGIVLLLAGISSAQAKKIELTAWQTWDPFNLLGQGAVGFILPGGEISCPGNVPTGLPLQPCPEGSRIQARGLKSVMMDTATDPRSVGEETVTVNLNYAADGTGPEWGTFSKKLDEGGVWEGTWEGYRSLAPAGCSGINPCWVEHTTFVGHGTGGRIEGMTLRGTSDAFSFPLWMLVRIGVAQAVILPPEE